MHNLNDKYFSFVSLLAPFVFLVGFSSAAHANEITQVLDFNNYASDSVPLTSGPVAAGFLTNSALVSVSPFDTSLGTLDSVTIDVSLTSTVNASGTAYGDSSPFFSWTDRVTATSYSPDVYVPWASPFSVAGTVANGASFCTGSSTSTPGVWSCTASVSATGTAASSFNDGSSSAIGTASSGPWDLGIVLLDDYWSDGTVAVVSSATSNSLTYNADLTGTFTVSYNYSPVPAPAAIWLFGSGLIGLIGVARRKRCT